MTRRLFRCLALAAVLLGGSGPRYAGAQVVDPEQPPTSVDRKTVVGGWILGGIAPINERATLVFGGLYGNSTGADLAGIFAVVNRTVSPAWMLVVGYVGVRVEVDDAADPTNHHVRLGAHYRRAWGRLSLDDRVLYEAVLTDQGRENGNRFRNRLRALYGLAPDLGWKPRLFGFAEPIYDDRFSAVQITHVAGGIGGSFGRIDADLFASRLYRKAGTGGDTDGLTLQLFYRF